MLATAGRHPLRGQDGTTGLGPPATRVNRAKTPIGNGHGHVRRSRCAPTSVE